MLTNLMGARVAALRAAGHSIASNVATVLASRAGFGPILVVEATERDDLLELGPAELLE